MLLQERYNQTILTGCDRHGNGGAGYQPIKSRKTKMSDVQGGFEPPIGGAAMPPKKSGNKIWLFGGIGCLLLSLLCVGGIGIGTYMAAGPIMEALATVDAAEAQIQSSPEVQTELGTPVVIARTTTDSNQQSMIVGGDVSGPQGNGTYKIELAADTSEGKIVFKTNSITVTANGKTIEVTDDLGGLENELNELEEGIGLE